MSFWNADKRISLERGAAAVHTVSRVSKLGIASTVSMVSRFFMVSMVLWFPS